MKQCGLQNFHFNEQFWRYRTPPYSDPRTLYFGFCIPPPFLRYNLAHYGLNRTVSPIVNHSKHGKQRLKSASNRLRDKKRLENFIERKSMCAALPFSHLSDQELTEMFFEGMIFSKLNFLYEKLSRAEWKIRSLVAEIDDWLDYGRNIWHLKEAYRDQITDLKTHEAELENTNSDLVACLENISFSMETQRKKLDNLQLYLSRKELEHSVLNEKLTELDTHSDKLEEENFNLRAHITDLEAKLAILQQQNSVLQSPPVQYNRRNRPPDRGRRRGIFRH